MKSLRCAAPGPVAGLIVRELPPPAPGPGEVLVRVRAAAVNPSDVKNVQGGFPQTTFPRTPGRDFAGVVEDGPPGWAGRPVFGSGGDLGFTRDGTHAEYLALPAAGVVPAPVGVPLERLAAAGVAYLTAWAAVVGAAGLKAGEVALLNGVTGAVGGAAACLAKRLGAVVVGVGREAARPATLDRAVDHWVTLSEEPLRGAVRRATGGRLADVALNVVGGPLLDPINQSLAHGGRHAVIAAQGDATAGLHLRDFYHNETRLLGVDSLKIDAVRAARVLDELAGGFADGSLGLPEVRAFPLAEAAAAYAAVAAGAGGRKVVVVP